MELRGNINDAIKFGRTQLGKPYDHEANTESRLGLREFDCSGFVTRCLWESGMPRYWQGFGEGSASMAWWCIKHPEMRLPVSAAWTTFGAIWVMGGTGGTGDAGHTGFGLGDGHTLESASGLHGVSVGNLSRYQGRITHVMLAPVHYDKVADKPKEDEEDEMFRVLKGDRSNDLWWTNWLEKRHIDTPQEATALINTGATQGAGMVTWPQQFVDNVPVREKNE